MKCISLRQPWVWAIFHGKDVENRTWKTNYRGPLLIHASKKWDSEGAKWIWRNMDIDIGILLKLMEDDSRFGAIIGQVDMVGCTQQSDSIWFFGPYGFIFEKPSLFGFPIPYKGHLGIFEVPDEVIFRRSEE